MDQLPIEIIQEILNNVGNIKDQTNLFQICRLFNDKLNIYYFDAGIYHFMINDEILEKYPLIKSLNISNNYEVTTVNHLTNLECLSVAGQTEMHDSGLLNLNLIELSVANNQRMKTIPSLFIPHLQSQY